MKKLLLSIMICMMMILIAGCEKTSKEASNMEGENGNQNGIQNEEINLDDYTGIFQSTNCDSNADIEKDGDDLKLTFDLYDIENVNFTSGTLVVSKSDMILDNGRLYVRPNNVSGYQHWEALFEMDERRVIFTITDLNGEYYSQDLYTEKQEEKISNDEIMKKFVGKYKGDEASFTIDKYKVGGSEVIMPIDVVLDLPGWGDRKDEFFINDIKNYADNWILLEGALYHSGGVAAIEIHDGEVTLEFYGVGTSEGTFDKYWSLKKVK